MTDPRKSKPNDEASSTREDEVLRRMLNTPPTPHKTKLTKKKRGGARTPPRPQAK